MAKQEFEEAHGLELQSFRDALTQFVARVENAIDDWYLRSEDRLSDLAIKIAREAICEELKLSRDSVVSITRQALQEVRHGTELRIKVNPLDVSILESRRTELLTALSGIRKLEVAPDLKMTAGCEIETDGGLVDASVDTYLLRLELEAA